MAETDDTSATPVAAPGYGRRALVRIGWRSVWAWIAEVVTLRRRIVAALVAVLVGVSCGLLFLRVFAGTPDDDGSTPVLAATVGLVLGAVGAAVPVTTWLARATRRNASPFDGNPSWRDAALLERSVDARGRVDLAPGTAERAAVESRRAIASSAIGIPVATIWSVVVVLGVAAMLAVGQAGTTVWFAPVWLLLAGSTVVTTSLAAGRMALLRDAADAELALPEAERPPAPPVAPPHGSRLP